MIRDALFLFVIVTGIVRDQPLAPAWSPDHQVLATTKVPEAFVTPEGGNYSLFFNGELVYPKKVKRWFSGYDHWHTFLSELAWSPDSRRVAFVEKIYSWEYSDPYNRDFEGTLLAEHFYLAIVSRDGHATGYALDHLRQDVQPRWISADEVVLDGRTFDLRAKPSMVK